MSILPQELRFTGDCLAAEPKNYHVWAHRQAVLLAANTAAGASAGGNSGGDGGDDCSASADAAAPHDGSDAVQPAAAAASAALDVAGEGTAPARPADGGEPGPSSGSGGGAGAGSGTVAAAAAASVWAAELELCRLHIQEDVRNNSAWAQRFFVLKHWCLPFSLGLLPMYACSARLCILGRHLQA